MMNVRAMVLLVHVACDVDELAAIYVDFVCIESEGHTAAAGAMEL